MDFPNKLTVALKEWDAVCRALGEGRQIVLLRKGGIYESAGQFEVEHRQFLLFPTFAHQNPAMLKPSEHDAVSPVTAEPKRITLALAGAVSDVVQVTSRQQIDAIDDQHVWTAPLIDMRFNYRPENPLYLLVVRAYRLARPVEIENTPAYAGCKSWVPLEEPVDTGGATVVLSEAEFEERRAAIRRAFEG